MFRLIDPNDKQQPSTYRIEYDEATQEHVLWCDDRYMSVAVAAYETAQEAEAARSMFESDNEVGEG